MAYRFSQKRVIAEVRLWQKRLGLQGYEVEITFTDRKPRDGTIAQLHYGLLDEGYKSVQLEIFVPMWTTETERARTLTLIHELRHIPYALISNSLEKYFGVGTLPDKALAAALETVCDADAVYFYRLFKRKSTA